MYSMQSISPLIIPREIQPRTPFTYPTLELGVGEGVLFARPLTWVYPGEEQVPAMIAAASLLCPPPVPVGFVPSGRPSSASVHVSLVVG